MADKSNIEWTDATWNPIVGCSIVSPGCTNCYAMKMAARIERMGVAPHYDEMTNGSKAGPVWSGKVALAPDRTLTAPLRWKSPRKIFVNSMGDLFHESIPDEWIDRVFAVMALCERHTFQILTKRADRMKSYINHWFMRLAESDQIFPHPAGPTKINAMFDWSEVSSTLPNVWLGVSCERQQEADERIPHLMQTPAAVRFVSAEPLLGPIDLNHIVVLELEGWVDALTNYGHPSDKLLDWVIVGGESGPQSRPFHLEWADGIVSQCREARVACFVKQFGSMPISDGYPLELRDRKGGDQSEWPDRLKVRQFPKPAARRSPVVNPPSNAEAIVR